MEYRKIKMPVALGLAISKALKEERGIQTQVNEYGLLDFAFFPEELELVQKIEIGHIKKDALEKIEHLKNLETLIISNESEFEVELNSDNNATHEHESDEYSIEDRDFMDIAQCKNLKKIVIIAQNKLKNVDLNYFEKLEHIEFR